MYNQKIMYDMSGVYTGMVGDLSYQDDVFKNRPLAIHFMTLLIFFKSDSYQTVLYFVLLLDMMLIAI